MRINLFPNNVLHEPSSYVIGIQRNHIFAQVKNPGDTSNTQYSTWFEEMLRRYEQIQPAFGNGKKLYRLGGNQIDGMISKLTEADFNNPSAKREFTEVITVCRDKINQVSKVENIWGTDFRVYKNAADANGPKDKFIYVENGDYKGYHWQDYKNQISNRAFPAEVYGQYDDIKYYVMEAQKMDADLTVTVNFSSGTPADAISLINEIKTLYGGTLQRVKFIELGNEISEDYIKANRKHFGVKNGQGFEFSSKSKDRLEYAHYALDFAVQLRNWLDTNGGNHVKIGAVGTTASNWYWNHPNNSSNKDLNDLLNGTNPSYPGASLKDYIDFVIFHSYPSYPLIHTGGEFNEPLKKFNSTAYTDDEMAKVFLGQQAWNIEKRIPLKQALIKNTTTKDIKIGNSEYYSHVNILTRPNLTHSISEAIYTADNILTALKYDMNMAVNFAFYHFQDNFVDISDNLLFELDPPGQVMGNKTVYAVQKMIAEEFGTQVIEASDDFHLNSSNDIDLSNLTQWRDHETNFSYKPISYVASKKSNGELAILLINRSDSDHIVGFANSTNQFGQINSISGNAYTDQRRLSPSGYQSIANLDNIVIPKLSVNIIKISGDVIINPNCNLDFTQFNLSDSEGNCKVYNLTIAPEAGTSVATIDLKDLPASGFKRFECTTSAALRFTSPSSAILVFRKMSANQRYTAKIEYCYDGDFSKAIATPENCDSIIVDSGQGPGPDGPNTSSFVIVPDINDPFSFKYKLNITSNISCNNVPIKIEDLPINGLVADGIIMTPGTTLEWTGQTSRIWKIPQMNANQPYALSIEYRFPNSTPEATATTNACQMNFSKKAALTRDGQGGTGVGAFCYISTSKFQLVDVGANCKEYVAELTFKEDVQNPSILINNLPTSAMQLLQVLPAGASTLNRINSTTMEWKSSQFLKDKTYTARLRFCGSGEYPNAYISFLGCDSIFVATNQ